MKNNVKHLDHLNLTVTSFEASAAWYQRVFGFDIVERGMAHGHPWGVLRAGDAMLCIYERPTHTVAPDDRHHRVSHFALRITDEAAWRATLEEEELPLGYGSPIEWPHSTAWYVTDPSGYEIEVAAWKDDAVRFETAA